MKSGHSERKQTAARLNRNRDKAALNQDFDVMSRLWMASQTRHRSDYLTG